MTAAAEGDRSVLDPLFHALWPIVAGYAARFLGDVALAEDAAQDTLVKLFSQLDRYDRRRDALTWTLAIATWECRTHRRKRHRRSEVPSPPESTIDGVRLAEDRELVRSALVALDTLAPRDREVIAAALDDDDPLRDTLAPATFRKRLERALGRFRVSWRSRHGAL